MRTFYLFFALLVISLLSTNLTNAQSIGTGPSSHTAVINSKGKLYLWGYNTSGQLGKPLPSYLTTPSTPDTSGILSGKTFIKVAMGYTYSLTISSDGKLFSWGKNDLGQLGNGTNISSKVPVQVDDNGILSGKTFVDIACGDSHCLAVDSDGKVYSWGNNTNGQLGNGNNTNSNTPVEVVTNGVLDGKTITNVAAGYHHSMALASDGTVYLWGYNAWGQFGNGNNTNSNVPVKTNVTGVLAGKTIIDIAAGYNHSVALTADGTIAGWGRNYNGQLGNGNTTDANLPAEADHSGILSGKNVIAISAGSDHTIALSNDGQIFSWGANNRGQLGNGTTTDCHIPVLVDNNGVLAGKTITAISCELFNTIALADDGSVFTWGRNNYGQLGNSSTINSSVPVSVISTALPVELVSFNGTFSNNSVNLNWNTESEVNNYGFEIHRTISSSEADQVWQNIGFVKGNGNSNSPKTYSFIDEQNLSGIINYRLKQIDSDGAFQYSDVIEVNATNQKNFKLEQNYPNPFNPTTTINYSIPVVNSSTNVKLIVYDMLGKVVNTLVNENQISGNYSVKFDGSKLTSGVYYYSLTAGSYKESKKFILLK